MEPPTDSKYIVFKRAAFEEWNKSDINMLSENHPDEVPDAVVIRRQDAFAPPALDAYANAIMCAVTLDNAINTNPHPALERLRDIADYFHDQAVAAWETHRKLPD